MSEPIVLRDETAKHELEKYHITQFLKKHKLSINELRTINRKRIEEKKTKKVMLTAFERDLLDELDESTLSIIPLLSQSQIT